MSSKSCRGIKAVIALLIAVVVGVAVLLSRQRPSGQRRAGPDAHSSVEADSRGEMIPNAGLASRGASRIDARIGDLDTTSIMTAARAAQRARALDNATREGNQIFVEQRASWLGVRTLSARYAWKQAGEASEADRGAPAARSGTIDFVISPLGTEAVASRYFKVTARVTDDELGVTMYKDNIWDPDEPVSWQYSKKGAAGDINQAAIDDRFESVCGLYVFEPLNGMSGTYRDSAWDSGPARDENKFHEWLGHFSVNVCERPSTPEETAAVFHGEPQYLIHLNPMPTGRYWVSQKKREIRRFEQEGYVGKGSVFAAEYSNYVRSEDGKAAFPTRLACSYRYPAGHPAAGREYGRILELGDVKINVPVELSLLRGETR